MTHDSQFLAGSPTFKGSVLLSMFHSDDTDSSPSHMSANSFRVKIVELEKMKLSLEKRIHAIDSEIALLESKYTGRDFVMPKISRRTTIRYSVDESMKKKQSMMSVESPTMPLTHKKCSNVSIQTQTDVKWTMWSRVKTMFKF